MGRYSRANKNFTRVSYFLLFIGLSKEKEGQPSHELLRVRKGRLSTGTTIIKGHNPFLSNTVLTPHSR